MLDDVSCTSANNCVAVGVSPSSNQEAVYANDTDGTWDAGGTVINPPANNNANNTYPSFSGVSGPTAGDCVAGGAYQTSGGGGYYGMVAEESARFVRPTTATQVFSPTGAYSNPSMTLHAISCTWSGQL